MQLKTSSTLDARLQKLAKRSRRAGDPVTSKNAKPSHGNARGPLANLAKRSHRAVGILLFSNTPPTHHGARHSLVKLAKRSQKTVALTLFPILLGGCIGQPLLGPLLAEPRSLVRLDESTQIRWLDADQLREAPTGVDPIVWRTHLAAEIPRIEPTDAKFLPAMLLPLAPVAAGLAIDALRSGLDAESKLYAGQFSASSATSEFWQIGATGAAQPRVAGLEVRRTARRFDDDQPAFVLRLALVPASDARLLLVRPLYFQTRAARAKLLLLDRQLETRVDLTLSSIYIDRTGSIVDQPIGSGTFRSAGYDLSQAAPRLIRGQTIAVLPAPPLVSDASGHPVNAVLQVRAVVTERDAARTQESFEQLSQQLTRDRAALIAATTQPLIR